MLISQDELKKEYQFKELFLIDLKQILRKS